MKCTRCEDDYSIFEMKTLNKLSYGRKIGSSNNPMKDSYCDFCFEVEAKKRQELGLPI